MEFHAVILCGAGHGLSPFSRVRSTGTPKALLPIANRPMVDYVIEWCEKAFFPKITIISDETTKDEIETGFSSYRAKMGVQKDVNIEFIAMNVESSGALLVNICKHVGLNKDFVILPCDFITDLPPQVLIEAYRSKSDSDIGLIVNYKNQLNIEDKKNMIFPVNYTIYSNNDDGNCQLLDLYSHEDIEFHKSLPIRTQMTWRYPNSTVSTKLLNSSIFFGSTNILTILESNANKFTDSYINNRPLLKIIRDLARRSWKHSKNLQTIALLIIPHQATFIRSNNTATLLEANRYFMKTQASNKAQNLPLQSKEKGVAHIGLDSLIGTNTTIGEKTNVKRSIIGENCIIGKRVKLTGCLILNGVNIEDDVQLENCIIGHDVVIQSKSKLTNTNVESTHSVPRGTMAKGETLLCLSLEGIVDHDHEYDDSDSEDSDESDSDTDDYEDDYVDNDDGLFDY